MVLNKIVKTFETEEMENSYKEFYNKFYSNGDIEESVARQLFLNNGAMDWRLKTLRNDIKLFLCELMENKDSLVIEDKEANTFNIFNGDNGLTFKEVETEDEGLTLHIKDNENEVTVKISSNSNLKEINLDSMILDERFMFECL